MSKYLILGAGIIVLILLSKYHYILSGYLTITWDVVIGVAVFGYYGMLATLVLLATTLSNKSPSYKNYLIHIAGGLFLGVGSFYYNLISGANNYAAGYIFLGVHVVISIIFLIQCIVFIPNANP